MGINISETTFLSFSSKNERIQSLKNFKNQFWSKNWSAPKLFLHLATQYIKRTLPILDYYKRGFDFRPIHRRWPTPSQKNGRAIIVLMRTGRRRHAVWCAEVREKKRNEINPQRIPRSYSPAPSATSANEVYLHLHTHLISIRLSKMRTSQQLDGN